MKPPPQPVSGGTAWAQSIVEVLAGLHVDPEQGLTDSEVLRQRQRYGRNQLQAAKRRHVLAILLDQFKSIVILLLTGAGILALLFADYAEGLAIFAVIIINGTIGFITEWRAIRSMEAIRRLGHVDTLVLRAGVVQSIPAELLVPGDIVIFEGGDIVTADVRLIEAAKLQANESTLTGESLPVRKQTEPVTTDTPVMERSNMVFKGTALTRGSGKGVVIGTGLNTELGRISELVTEAEAQQTPLEKRLDALGSRLAWVVLLIGLLIGLAGILAGREVFLAIEVAIALAVAAIPEGLPIVATIALARGMWRMATHNALISRLSAVETLGATSVILTDKTGTLTENRMTVTTIRLADADIEIEASGLTGDARISANGGELMADTTALLDEFLTNAALCSNASFQVAKDGDVHAVGDPTELALLVAASKRNIWRHDVVQKLPEVREVPFDPDSKLMATLHNGKESILVAVKGAPESLIQLCHAIRTDAGDKPLSSELQENWLDKARQLGDRGLRTLAVASKTTTDSVADPYIKLVLLGIAGLEDPPREGVDTAIDRCRSAGISVVMVTGDHAATARNIATELGMVTADAGPECFIGGEILDRLLADAADERLLQAIVFSRVTPEQKLNLIDFYQRQGQIVAMTGDGVNDAPALKKADIGVAMGIRGTDVAKQASAMVLQDDEFNSIVEAVAQGRAIFENIRKFVVYLLSCNISEVLIVTLATVAGAPLPLLPLQILFLNLVTDVFPALALGVGRGSSSLMDNPPRAAGEHILTRGHWMRISLHGAGMALAVLAAMAVAVFYLDFDRQRAVTVSFCSLALAQLWHVFNMRQNINQLIKNEITRNVWVWGAVAICLLLILFAVYTPLLSGILHLTDPGAQGWLLIVGFSLVPLLIAPLVRKIADRHKPA